MLGWCQVHDLWLKKLFFKNLAKQSSTRKMFWIAKISLSSRRYGHQNYKKHWASDNSVLPNISVNWDNSSKATEGRTISTDGGGDSLKLCLSIFDTNDSCSTTMIAEVDCRRSFLSQVLRGSLLLASYQMYLNFM